MTPFLGDAEAALQAARAEAEAQDAANRLRVAQVQLYEYATQKEKDAAELELAADAAHNALQAAVAGSADGAASLEAVRMLREKVQHLHGASYGL